MVKYTLGFVRAINKMTTGIWYREEILELMDKHGMPEEDKQVIKQGRLRWYPAEVFKTLEAPR